MYMKSVLKRAMTVILSLALGLTVFLGLPLSGKVAYAANEVTIIGTIQNTRSYYNVDGPVSAYCFFPSTLSTYTVGKKQVEITEFSAGVNPDVLGTNDLSSYVGATKAYTGVIANSPSAPFTYTFVISSVADATIPTMTDMDNYLKGLGFSTTTSDMGNGEYFIGCFGWNNTVTFSYHTIFSSPDNLSLDFRIPLHNFLKISLYNRINSQLKDYNISESLIMSTDNNLT